MNTSTTILLIVVVGIVVIVVALALYYRKNRTRKLRARFGPEYDRVVGQQNGNTTRAEAILEKRQKRIEKLQIRRLRPDESGRFSSEWRTLQELFVDRPQEAITRADGLVTAALNACGYPAGDFEQRAVDISVEHPQAVEHYRSAHDIAAHASRGETSTEDLRRAMQHYRSVLEDVLEIPVNQPEEVHR
jgi:hypothetical protein